MKKAARPHHSAGAEARFQHFLARSNLLHCLGMHLLYVTAIQLSFVLRTIGEDGCEAQRAAGAVLPQYPCGGPTVAQARHVLAHALFYFVERPARLADFGVAFNTAAMLLVTAWLLLLSVLLAAAALAQASRRRCSRNSGGWRPAGRGRAPADPRGFSGSSKASLLLESSPADGQPLLDGGSAGVSSCQAPTAAAGQQQQPQPQLLLLPPPQAAAHPREPLVCRVAALCWRAWLRGRTTALTVTPLQSWCVALPLTLLLHSYGCCPPAIRSNPSAEAAASAVAAAAAAAGSGAVIPSSGAGSAAGGAACALAAQGLLSLVPDAAAPAWRRLGSYQLVMGAVQRPVWDMAVTALLMDGMRLRFRHMAAVSLLRATAVSLTAAFVQVREAAAASAAAPTDAGHAAAAAGGLEVAPPLAVRLRLAAAWARAALRHLAVLLPLACVPLLYWWWSEQRLRRRLTLLEAAAAADAASVGSGQPGGSSDSSSATASCDRAMALATDGAAQLKPRTTKAGNFTAPAGSAADGASPASSPFGLQALAARSAKVVSAPIGPTGGAALSAGGSGSWGAGAVAVVPAAIAAARPTRLTSAYSSGALSCSHAQDMTMSALLTSADSSLSNGSGASCLDPAGGVSSGSGSSSGAGGGCGAGGVGSSVSGSASATAAAAVSAMADVLRSDFASAMSSCSWLSDDETITSGSMLGNDDHGPAIALELPPPQLLLSTGALHPQPLPRRSLDSFLSRASPAARGDRDPAGGCISRGRERGGSAPAARMELTAAAAGAVKTDPAAPAGACAATASSSCSRSPADPPHLPSTAAAAPPPQLSAPAAAAPPAGPPADSAVPAAAAGVATGDDGANPLVAAAAAMPQPPAGAPASKAPATPLAATAEVITRTPSPSHPPLLLSPALSPAVLDATVLAQPVLRGTLHATPAAAAATQRNSRLVAAGRLRPLGCGGGITALAAGGQLQQRSVKCAAPYVGLTSMSTFSVKVRNPTGSHEEYAARLAAAVTPLILPPGIAAQRQHAPSAAAPAAHSLITIAAVTPQPLLCLLPAGAGASILTSGSGGSTHLITQPSAPGVEAPPASTITGGSTAHASPLQPPSGAAAAAAAAAPAAHGRTGGYVVVQGCVQLIAWVRGVDGAMVQRVVELNEEMAAALGLDAAAVAALMRQQEQQLQQAPQRTLPPLLEAAGGAQEETPEQHHSAAQLALLPPASSSSGQVAPAAVPVTAAPLQPGLGVAPPATTTGMDLPQALVQAVPDASRVGQWTVQTPAAAAATAPPPHAASVPPLAMPAGGLSLSIPVSPTHKVPIPGAFGGAATAQLQTPHLPTSPRSLALPPGAAPASGPLSQPNCAGGTVGATAAAHDNAGALTIECAWTPCVPTSPASSPPLELELGLTSAAPQTLRLLLVQHGTLLADFTCVLGAGPQVLLLPVPPQPQPTVMQLVFAPAAGAATASTPLLYDIATLLAVPDDVAAELAELSQVMRMEYGNGSSGNGSSSSTSTGGGAAWRDHYAPLISDLAYIMERAELAAAASAAAAASGAAAEAAAGGSRPACAAAGRMAAERAALAANAAADGPSAVLRVAQQLVTYLQANGMAATARFVMATVHQALQLHLMLDEVAAAAGQRLAAAPGGAAGAGAGDARLQAVAGPAALGMAGGGDNAIAVAGGAGSDGSRSPRVGIRLPALGAAPASAVAPASLPLPSRLEAQAGQELGGSYRDGSPGGVATAAAPSMQRQPSSALKLLPALPSPFSAALQPLSDRDGRSSPDDGSDTQAAADSAPAGPDEQLPVRQASTELKLPPPLASPFSAAMRPWGEEESSSDEAEAAEQPRQLDPQPPSPPLKLPPSLPSPFSAAMQPWSIDDGGGGDEGNSSASPSAGGSSATSAGAADAPALLQQPSAAMKLPPQLPSPFAAATEPWSRESHDGSGSDSDADACTGSPPLSHQPAPAPAPTALGSPARQASQQIKLPRGLPSPFAAAQEPWDDSTSSSTGDTATPSEPTPQATMALQASRQPSTAPIKLPRGLPSPFAGTLAPWSDASSSDGDEQSPERPVQQPEPERQHSALRGNRGGSDGRQASRQRSTVVPPADEPGEAHAASRSRPTSLQRRGSRHVGAAAHRRTDAITAGLRAATRTAEEHPPGPSFSSRSGGHSARSCNAAASSAAASSSLSSASPFALIASRPPRIRFDDGSAGGSASGRSSCSASGGDGSGDSKAAAPAIEAAGGQRYGCGGSGGTAAAPALGTAATAGAATPWSAALPPSPFLRSAPTLFAALEPAASASSGRVTATQPSNSSRASPPFSGRTTAEVHVALCEPGMSAVLSRQLTGPTTPTTQASVAHHSMTGTWQQHPAMGASPTSASAAASAAASRGRGGLVARRSTDSAGAATLAARRATIGGAGGPADAAAESAAAGWMGLCGLQRVRSVALRGDRASAEAAACGPGRSSGGGPSSSVEAAAPCMALPPRQPRISEHGNDPSSAAPAAAGAASPSAGRGYLSSDLCSGLAWEEVVTTVAMCEPGGIECGSDATAQAGASVGATLQNARSSAVPGSVTAPAPLPASDPGASGSNALSPAVSNAADTFVKGGYGAADVSGDGFARCASLSGSSVRSSCCVNFRSRSASDGSADAFVGRTGSLHVSSSGGGFGRMGSQASLGSGGAPGRTGSGRRSAMGASLALLTRPRIMQALQDSCLGYSSADAALPPQRAADGTAATTTTTTTTGSAPGAAAAAAPQGDRKLRPRRGSAARTVAAAAALADAAASTVAAVRHRCAALRRRRLTRVEAAYGLYHARQALALDSWTLAYIALKAVVCLAMPLVTTGTLERQELLLVGPHLLLRMLSFAPKAAVLLLALYAHACAALTSQHARAGPATPLTVGLHARLGAAPAATALAVADPAWAVAWREAWVLACGYAELLLLMAPMALGLLPPPRSLVTRLRGLGLEVLMDGVQRVAFDQVRTWRRLPQHTLHCGLVYVLAAHQLQLPHAAALAALTWLAGLVTCLVLEVPRRVDFAALRRGPAAAAAAAPPPAVRPVPRLGRPEQAPAQAS
ncbi:hypothetical protein HXX76_001246 [Chlamydomonas incerta]|uniref:Uncharacterized protein n=1 Tax=Chlamydomonas incerta TaxID=51695 RepID=A0A835WBT7_CHLIN|nr:hypothetical protein HXX76_001246 [Chlamydomonas incerta]|eukprot:KAG2444497.1 hypothetical protein HXX76_001246 [Chlamydomonas incerta]